MDFEKKSVLGLFDGSRIQYSIPLYQRAYAWNEENWKVFLEDVEEASKSENPYFYGNILLETVETDRKYDIIDGQQRITTLILFFYSIYKVKLTKFNITDEDIYETYVKNKFGYKLEPVDYDRPFFSQLLNNNNNNLEPLTPSQIQLKKCVIYFEKALYELDLKQIESLKETIQESIITIVKLKEKKESALMFELQNNRGLSLTNMEKLKSYLMYQVYVHSNHEETEPKLECLGNIFKEIYRLIPRCVISEDAILTAHCQVYINGFNYRTLEDIKDQFKKSTDKIEWIEEFTQNLYRSFQIILEFQVMDTKDVKLLKHNISNFVYPFIIKGFSFINKDKLEQRNQLIQLLEIVLFRYKLINSRADLISRLNPILTQFDSEDIKKLALSFKKNFNDTWYWGDSRVIESIYNINYIDNKPLVKYVLSVYEDIELAGQPFERLVENKDIHIEHIYPQTESSEPISDGYDLSQKEEEHSKYIHCLGNLLLIDSRMNSTIGNKPYKEKLNSYDNGCEKYLTLQQQIKVKNHSKDKWCDKCIDDRYALLSKFINDFWSFDRVINQIL